MKRGKEKAAGGLVEFLKNSRAIILHLRTGTPKLRSKKFDDKKEGAASLPRRHRPPGGERLAADPRGSGREKRRVAAHSQTRERASPVSRPLPPLPLPPYLSPPPQATEQKRSSSSPLSPPTLSLPLLTVGRALRKSCVIANHRRHAIVIAIVTVAASDRRGDTFVRRSC